MLPIALLAASGIMSPVPTIAPPWVEGEDYPIYAFQRRWEGATEFELTVDPTGRPTNCVVTKSSGYEVLDQRACTTGKRKARFQPARDAAGEPTYGVYKSRLNWAIDPELFVQSEAGPDFEVSLSKLPASSDGQVSVKYALMVDAAGKATTCNAISQAQPVLVKLGCDKLMQDYVVGTNNRAPAAAVRTAWITFVEG